MSTTLVLLAGALVAATSCGLAIFIRKPELLASIALMLAFAAQTTVGGLSPLISRVPILLITALAIKLAFDAGRSRQLRAGAGNAVRIPVLMITGLAAATIATSVSPAISFQAAVAGGALFYSATTIPRFMPIADLMDRIGRLGAVTVIGSLLLAPILPGAFLSGRLAGVFRNPNTLGAAAVLACSAIPSRHLARLGPPIVLATLLSGSRSSGLGVLIVLFVRIRWTPARTRAAILMVPLLTVGALLVAPPPAETNSPNPPVGGEGPAILRTRDNRSGQWSQGVADSQANLPFGSGFGTSQFEYSNSGLFLLVETGILSLPIAGFTLALAGQARRHRDRRVFALVLSMFVQSQFEGWMFAFGSFQATLFWLIVIASATERSMPAPRAAGQPSTDGPSEPTILSEQEWAAQNSGRPRRWANLTPSALSGVNDG